MKGLRLFVRPVDASDERAVQDFLSSVGAPAETPARALLAKLLGDVVALLKFSLDDGVLVIDELLVSEHLRRKQIGRSMLREASELARRMELPRIEVRRRDVNEQFLRRVGFVREGEHWKLDSAV